MSDNYLNTMSKDCIFAPKKIPEHLQPYLHKDNYKRLTTNAEDKCKCQCTTLLDHSNKVNDTLIST